MKTDTASFLQALLSVADSPDRESRPFQNSTIYDFHPEFIAAVDSFIDGFREFLATREIEIPSTRNSFGGNVFFSLSGHGVGFWDDSESEHLQPLLVEYSASLPTGYRDPAHRFEELESSLSKRRGGKIDLAILAKFLPESRRKLFGMAEPDNTSKTYSIRLTLKDGGGVCYLSHKGRTSWSWKTAKRHLETMDMSGNESAMIEEN